MTTPADHPDVAKGAAFDRLSVRQRVALDVLATGGSLEDAAARALTPPHVVRRWQRSARFRQALGDQKAFPRPAPDLIELVGEQLTRRTRVPEVGWEPGQATQGGAS